MAEMESCTIEEGLKAWTRGHVGSTFASGRAWSAEAGLTVNAVSDIQLKGRSSCSKLIALARAAGDSPLRVLVIGGYLTAAEAGADQAGLTEAEAGFLEKYRQTRPDLRRVVEASLRGAWATSRGGE